MTLREIANPLLSYPRTIAFVGVVILLIVTLLGTVGK